MFNTETPHKQSLLQLKMIGSTNEATSKQSKPELAAKLYKDLKHVSSGEFYDYMVEYMRKYGTTQASNKSIGYTKLCYFNKTKSTSKFFS